MNSTNKNEAILKTNSNIKISNLNEMCEQINYESK